MYRVGVVSVTFNFTCVEDDSTPSVNSFPTKSVATPFPELVTALVKVI